MIVELAQLVGLDADLRPRAIVRIVGVGHDGIQSVVAAGQLEDDQNAIGITVSGCVCPRSLAEQQRQAEPPRKPEARPTECSTQESATVCIGLL